MPKKYTRQYPKPSNSYVHPSLQITRPSSTTSPPPPQNVNERIRQLRRDQAPRASIERRNEMNDVPGTRPPIGTRVPESARPPAGPETPRSWLRHFQRTLDPERRWGMNQATKENSVAPKFCSLATMEGSNLKNLSPDRSLVHLALKTMASHWEELAEYEQHYLATLPTPLKEALLSYLSCYGRSGCLNLKSFKLLFLDAKEVEAGSGSDEIHFLDLTRLLNGKFTISDLHKYMTRSKPSVSTTLADLSISDETGKPKSTESGKPDLAEEVVDSWEDAADLSMPSIPATISISRFPLLTRLSLAHPGPWASWPHLLNLSKNLHTLTHLSLAYWPKPTATPNATTSSMVSSLNKPICFGGTSFYAELDDDWDEAANILRRLSKNTYCLKWLDLEGCTWHRALAWGLRDIDTASSPRPEILDNKPWSTIYPEVLVGPDFEGPWRQIEYLNLSQGWVPQDAPSIQCLPAGIIPVELLSWLRNLGEDDPRPPTKTEFQEWSTSLWVQSEKAGREIAEKLLRWRRSANAPYMKVDFGWAPPAMAKKKEEV